MLITRSRPSRLALLLNDICTRFHCFPPAHSNRIETQDIRILLHLSLFIFIYPSQTKHHKTERKRKEKNERRNHHPHRIHSTLFQRHSSPFLRRRFPPDACITVINITHVTSFIHNIIFSFIVIIIICYVHSYCNFSAFENGGRFYDKTFSYYFLALSQTCVRRTEWETEKSC